MIKRLEVYRLKKWKSEGDGTFSYDELGSCGEHVIIEDGVRIFHPENVHLGDNVYIGHDTIIKGYYKDTLRIASNSWIGQQCFIHGAGGVEINEFAGIGPAVRMLASFHIDPDDVDEAIVFSPLVSSPIIIEKNCNIGIGATILGGVTIGANSKIGANALVNKTIPPYSIAVGVPAKVIKNRQMSKKEKNTDDSIS